MKAIWILGLNVLPIVCVVEASRLLVMGIEPWWCFFALGATVAMLPKGVQDDEE